MKMQTLKRGAILACLLISCVACTGIRQRPLEVRAADAVVVTKTEYIPVSDEFLKAVEAAWGFTDVWANGGMYSALAHDSKWLDTCKGQIDQIRVLYEKQAKTKSKAKTP